MVPHGSRREMRLTATRGHQSLLWPQQCQCRLPCDSLVAEVPYLPYWRYIADTRRSLLPSDRLVALSNHVRAIKIQPEAGRFTPLLMVHPDCTVPITSEKTLGCGCGRD